MVTAPWVKATKAENSNLPKISTNPNLCVQRGNRTDSEFKFCFIHKNLATCFSHININIKQPLKSCVEELISTWSYKPIKKPLNSCCCYNFYLT